MHTATAQMASYPQKLLCCCLQGARKHSLVHFAHVSATVPAHCCLQSLRHHTQQTKCCMHEPDIGNAARSKQSRKASFNSVKRTWPCKREGSSQAQTLGQVRPGGKCNGAHTAGAALCRALRTVPANCHVSTELSDKVSAHTPHKSYKPPHTSDTPAPDHNKAGTPCCLFAARAQPLETSAQ